MARWYFLLAFAGTLALVSCGRKKAYDVQLKLLPNFGVIYIKPDSLAALLKSNQQPMLLDTRDREEWTVSRLPGAQVVEVKSFNVSQLDSVPRDTPIVLYCSVGYRSGEVGKKLQEAGFTKVRNLYGGILEWKNQGYALVTPTGALTEQVHTYNSYWASFLEKGQAVY